MSEAIQNFIKHAYLDKKIERFSAGIVQNTQHEKNAMPTQIFNTYQKIIIRLFDPATLIKSLENIIARNSNEQQMQKILHFLLQPKIQQITQNEEAAKSLQASQEMQTFFTALQTTPPSDTRKRLI